MIFRRNAVIGLDIQPNAIYFVQLDRNHCLQQRFTFVTKQTYSNDGKIENWEALSTALCDMVQQHTLRRCKVAISLTAAQVHVHNMKLSASLTPAEFEYEIDNYIAAELPWMKTALCKDYHIDKHADATHCDVTVLVTRQAYIEQLSQCLKRARLGLKIIDVDIYALDRIARYLLGNDFKHDYYLILHVNKTIASLIVSRAGQLSLLQQWGVADELAFAEHAAQQIQLALQLQSEKPTGIVLCGINAYLDLMRNETYAIPVYRPQLPIEDQYWLAFSLALRRAV